MANPSLRLHVPEANRMRILVVDDDELNLEILVRTVEEQGFVARPFDNPVKAWQFLESSPGGCDIAVLDKMMPEMDGMEMLRRIKSNPSMLDMPVILQTGDVGTEQMRQGIIEGAFYYLTKPFTPDLLAAVLEAAAREVETHRSISGYVRAGVSLTRFLRQGEFSVRTPGEARELAAVLARMTSRPQQVSAGLNELMMNAIEHGNLECGFELKKSLVSESGWDQEVVRRLATPPYAGRSVRVTVERTPEALSVTIADCGKGFDWLDYFRKSDMGESLTGPNGRGIAKAMFWLGNPPKYNAEGNEVTVRISDRTHGPTALDASLGMPIVGW